MQLAEDKEGNEANAFLSPLEERKQMKISSGYFRNMKEEKMVIKYGSCTACTFFDCAGVEDKNIALLARFTEAFPS